VLHQTEDAIVHIALAKLDDHSADVRKVVTDLVISGFDDVDELVELTVIAKESILTIGQDEKSLARTQQVNTGNPASLHEAAMPSTQPS
jgi:hypothetical protein